MVIVALSEAWLAAVSALAVRLVSGWQLEPKGAALPIAYSNR